MLALVFPSNMAFWLQRNYLSQRVCHRHRVRVLQVFLEPEGRHSPEVYVQGFSTGLPERLQLALLHTLPGEHYWLSLLAGLAKCYLTLIVLLDRLLALYVPADLEKCQGAHAAMADRCLQSHDCLTITDQQAPLGLAAGLEQCKMLRPAYAVEYDYLPAHQCSPSLQTKRIGGLFFSGQLNGTTGISAHAKL